MSLYILTPESPGRLGPKTRMYDVQPPEILNLHVVLTRWYGDEIVSVFPSFLVSSKLAEALTAAGLTGFELRDVEVESRRPTRKEVDFKWLLPIPGGNDPDLFLTTRHKLAVSRKALEVILSRKPYMLKYEQVVPLSPAQHRRALSLFWAAFALGALGTIAYAVCLNSHWCMCGHLCHEAMISTSARLIDAAVAVSYSLSMIVSLKIPVPKQQFYGYFLLALLLSGCLPFMTIPLIGSYVLLYRPIAIGRSCYIVARSNGTVDAETQVG